MRMNGADVWMSTKNNDWKKSRKKSWVIDSIGFNSHFVMEITSTLYRLNFISRELSPAPNEFESRFSIYLAKMTSSNGSVRPSLGPAKSYLLSRRTSAELTYNFGQTYPSDPIFMSARRDDLKTDGSSCPGVRPSVRLSVRAVRLSIRPFVRPSVHPSFRQQVLL